MALVRAILGGIAVAGGDATALAREVGIDLELLGNADARVPGEIIFDLFDRAPEVTHDPMFGLHLAVGMPPGAMAVCEYAVRSAPNVHEALLVMLRYYALVHEQTQLELQVKRGTGRIVHHDRKSRSVPRTASELLLASIVHRGRLYTSGAFPLRAVSFMHPAPEGVAELERFFGVPVHFGAPVNEVVFEARWLEQPLATADPALHAVLERYADALLEKLPRGDPFLDNVRRAIAEALRGRDPSLQATAARLGIGARTLQRRLAAHDTKHQDLVEEVRHEFAARYLVHEGLGVSEAAYLLGFSEPSAFHRAFRRWTGKTPVEYKKAAVKAAS
jgi:AraC-like DNA-binding protein